MLKDDLVKKAKKLSPDTTMSGLLNNCLAEWIARHNRNELKIRLAAEYRAARGESRRVSRDFTHLSRAGASILGEYPLFGLPAIVVPYPHAWRYQLVNARYLEERGAAVMLQDEARHSDLALAILDLLHDTTRREKMHVAMRSLSQPEATATVGNLLWVLAAQRGQGRN